MARGIALINFQLVEEVSEGFLTYTPKHLPKIDAIRRAKSQPDIFTVPTPTKGEVLFVTAAEMHNEPASCYNCGKYNLGKSCMVIGPHVEIRKFIYGGEKKIEFWPCCSYHGFGDPNEGPEKFTEANDPVSLGLIWINAPKVGQKLGGANCGGENGGDDCDFFMTTTDDKRSAPTGFCRVLQAEVENGAVCTCWRDDDLITYQDSRAILEEQS